MRKVNDSERSKGMAATIPTERSTRNGSVSLSVDPKTVRGRRELHFTSLQEVLADAEKLVSSPTTRTLGNWPLGQLLAHLAMAMNRSIDGISFKAPWYMRLFGRLIKRRILERGMKPGFNLPKDREAGAYPAVASPQEALDILRQAVSRLRNEKATATHPVFGRLTHEEWIQLHLRHAELHLSFAVFA
jgi:hypothetical protein